MTRLRKLLPLTLLLAVLLTFVVIAPVSANPYAPGVPYSCGGYWTLYSSVNFNSSNVATYGQSGPAADTTVRIEKYTACQYEYAVVRSYFATTTNISVGLQNAGLGSSDYGITASYTPAGPVPQPGYTNLACGGAGSINAQGQQIGNGGCTNA